MVSTGAKGIRELESLVNNGGFRGYFGNGAESASFALTALRAIGALQCAAILEKAITLIPARLPTELNPRWELVHSLPEPIDSQFSTLDERFFAYPDDLTELLYAYVVKHPNVFGPTPTEDCETQDCRFLAQHENAMTQLLRFPSSVKRDPAIEVWMREHSHELGAIARRWFEIMRNCGDDVQELLHDGHPTACVGDAAFCYVNAFNAHVNVGFFRGAEIPDPTGLLEGTGKFMRHVKLKPERDVDDAALVKLIEIAYADMRGRLNSE